MTIIKLPRYHLYIDESGDHSCKDIDRTDKRYLALAGCVIENDFYRLSFQPEFEKLKQKHFPHNPDEPLIFHRSEIINKRGLFKKLQDEECKRLFNQEFLKFIKDMEFILITVVIDKKAHIERYGKTARHPYHYCLAMIMERYCGLLNYFKARGDITAESRGKEEDILLKAEYKTVYENGTYYRSSDFFQNSLTSNDIKVKPKKANIAGLQFSDLLAHPSKQQILSENNKLNDYKNTFGNEMCRIFEDKYNRNYNEGRIKGYGKILLS